jgi:hypothetical protein
VTLLVLGGLWNRSCRGWVVTRVPGQSRRFAQAEARANPMSAESRWEMDESKRRAVELLEKEIKTYIALALFLSKKGIKERMQLGDDDVVISPTYYKERMREARKIVNELRKPS